MNKLVLQKTGKLRVQLVVLSGVLFLLLVAASPPIELRTSRTMKGQLNCSYHVLKSDTSVLHGPYALYYKSHLVEAGRYTHGQRTGVWTFLNLGRVLEFKYDYDADSIVLVAGYEEQRALAQNSDCMFLGSSLVPYAHLTSLVGYPSAAYEADIEGVVDLYMDISAEGAILRRYLGPGAPPELGDAVLEASRQLPEDWRWLPQRVKGKKQRSLYRISIHFELKHH